MVKRNNPSAGPVKYIDPASLGLSGPQKMSPMQMTRHRDAVATREAEAILGPMPSRKQLIAEFAESDRRLGELNAANPTAAQTSLVRRQ